MNLPTNRSVSLQDLEIRAAMEDQNRIGWKTPLLRRVMYTREAF